MLHSEVVQAKELRSMRNLGPESLGRRHSQNMKGPRRHAHAIKRGSPVQGIDLRCPSNPHNFQEALRSVPWGYHVELGRPHQGL